MNFNINHPKAKETFEQVRKLFKKYITFDGEPDLPSHKGKQIKLTFPNQFQASVLFSNISQGHDDGLCEVAMMYNSGEIAEAYPKSYLDCKSTLYCINEIKDMQKED